MQKYVPEIQSGWVILRIYKDDRRTAAYLCPDLDKPRPEFVPEEVWVEAQEMQRLEDSKPF